MTGWRRNEGLAVFRNKLRHSAATPIVALVLSGRAQLEKGNPRAVVCLGPDLQYLKMKKDGQVPLTADVILQDMSCAAGSTC